MRFLPVYEKFRNDIEFMMIYVREAHPNDKWWLAETKLMRFFSVMANDYPSYDLFEPTTIEERLSAAAACRAKLLGDMPVYVDAMDNKVNDAYVGWPTRIYFIDENGKVRYESGLGPYGFSPDALEAELEKYFKARS